MSSTEEKKELILRYYETINYHPDIEKWKHYEFVWEWWLALAYFGIDHQYRRLEDAPAGVKWITVMDGDRKNYVWKNGEYRYLQKMTKEECKAIYGDRVPGK